MSYKVKDGRANICFNPQNRNWSLHTALRQPAVGTNTPGLRGLSSPNWGPGAAGSRERRSAEGGRVERTQEDHRALEPRHSLADVLRVQLLPTSLALKTAQMPVLVQGHQGLAVLDFCAAAPATWKNSRRRCCGPGGVHHWVNRHHKNTLSGPGEGPVPSAVLKGPCYCTAGGSV